LLHHKIKVPVPEYSDSRNITNRGCKKQLDIFQTS